MKRFGMVLLALWLGACEHFNPSNGKITAHVVFASQNLGGIRMALPEIGDTTLTDSAGVGVLFAPPGTYALRVFGVPVPGQAMPYIDRRVQVDAGATTSLEIEDSLIAGDVVVGDSISLSIFASSLAGTPASPISFHVQVTNLGHILWQAQGDCAEVVPGLMIRILSSQADSFYTFPFWAEACDPISVTLVPGRPVDGTVVYFGDLYHPPSWFFNPANPGNYWAVATYSAAADRAPYVVDLQSRDIPFHWSWE